MVGTKYQVRNMEAGKADDKEKWEDKDGRINKNNGAQKATVRGAEQKWS